MTQTIAQTITKQIGSNVWFAVSARDPKWWTKDTGDVVVAFRFGSRYGLPKWCEITYKQGIDTYDVSAYKIHRNGAKRMFTLADKSAMDGLERSGWEGIYADRLAEVVRRANLMGELA